MNLALKLDRLRGRSEQQSGALSRRPDTADDGLPLRVSRRNGAALATVLHAEEIRPGLLFRSESVTMGFSPLDVNLSALPDLPGGPDRQGTEGREWVYLDTETTGLSGGAGNLAFMVGLARWSDNRTLGIEQFVLARFDAESDLLDLLMQRLPRDAVVVTFNGKSFDMPLLRSRCALHKRNDGLAGLGHLDLVHTVRRAYRRFWPDCRLQTAEKSLLGLFRVDDLPGAEAPAAWRDWLRSGSTRALSGVLAHNAQDVLSLALLHYAVLPDYQGISRAGVDYTAIGLAWWRAGFHAQAEAVWTSAAARLDDRGQLLMASACRRRGDWMKAQSIWQQLHDRGNRHASAELSKYFEHRCKDYTTAMHFAQYCEGEEREVRCMRLAAKQASGWKQNRRFRPVNDRQLSLLHESDLNAMK